MREVAQAIYDYLDNKEPMLPGPDFPTGGIVINAKDIPNIMRTGKGTIKIRGKYNIEDRNIVFTELPYGINTESLMNDINDAEIEGISNIRNESNKKGFRLVIECEKNISPDKIVNKLFSITNLQYNFSYNQVALVNRTPLDLNLKQCIEIYIDHNISCLVKEVNFDINKTNNRLEIVNGLLKALEDINNIIELIKKSDSSSDAKTKLIEKYKFSDVQAQAIIDMKLGRLAGLEKIELQNEKASLEKALEDLKIILADPIAELVKRLKALVNKYGDDRRTILTDIEVSKESKEEKIIEPEKCVVLMSETGLIKRVAATSFKTQSRNTKGVKSPNDIITNIIRTNTIDKLMAFSNKGRMYCITVNDIPENETAIQTLIKLDNDENISVIYSIYKDTDAEYVLFTTRNGLIKKIALTEFDNSKNKKTGVQAIKIQDGDSIASVNLIKHEEVIITTYGGMTIRFETKDINATGRTSMGVKAINLKENDFIVSCWPIRHNDDTLALFFVNGSGKRVILNEFSIQNRGGKGVMSSSKGCEVVGTALLSDEDKVLIMGDRSNICIEAKDINICSRSSNGIGIIKDNSIVSISKV